MKKLLLLLTVCLLVSCGPTSEIPTEVDPTTGSPTVEPTIIPTEEPTVEPTESPTVEPTEIPTETPTETPSIDEPVIPEEVFISEVYGTSKNVFSRAIEIGNVGTTLDLSGYSLRINSGKRLLKEVIFEDGTTIEQNGTYVIANKSNDDYNYHSKANLILEDNYINGSNYIEFVNPKGQVFDVLGSIYKFEYAINQSYLRLPSKFISNETYDQLSFIKVRVDETTSYLGNLECPFESEEDLEFGPRITEELYNYSFEEGTSPGGGFAEATVSSYGDGDTTVFRFLKSYDNVESSERTRYMFINCPEISHGANPNDPDEGAEPWGYAGKLYNNQILRGAKSILIQSVKGYGFREVYGRLLGFVWYTTVENPKLSDYRLLNYQLLYEGYAYFGDGDVLNELYSGDVYYHSYFEYANIRAQKLGLKIHGEIDPNYDY